jgi:hypothetical protein
MNPNKALWEKGDFTRIAASMRESGPTFTYELIFDRPAVARSPSHRRVAITLDVTSKT